MNAPGFRILLSSVATGLALVFASHAQESGPSSIQKPEADAILEGTTKPEAPSPANSEKPPAPPPESSLVWWNRPIATFRSSTTQLPPDNRSSAALERIDSNADILLETKVTAEPAELENDKGYRFLAGESYLFTLLESDLEELSGEGLEAARDEVLARFAEVQAARIKQGSAQAIAQGATATVIATVTFGISLLLLRFLSRIVSGFVERKVRSWKRLRLARADLRPHIATLAEQLVKIAALLLSLNLFCLWIAFSFNQFPLTEPLGLAFTERLKEFGTGLLRTAAGSIPGLVTAGIIFLIARWIARLTDRVIRSMGRNDDTGILAADTAKATRRIAVAVIWIFAIVLAYPYLPGSDSDAFKGISVLLGLMVSLGSTGLINQIMSGFVLLYSGSVRTGEYVRIGEIEGTITEMGMLAVKLLTPQKEFLTIPNAVMIGNPSTNYSRLSKETGVPLTISVTIGYDAPWRRVHQLLNGAARSTDGVVDSPEPRVLQKELSDWYAQYNLTCYIAHAERRNAVISELNGQIQDAFNDAGIQIMSPHYFDDKAQPLVVPREKWFPSTQLPSSGHAEA